MPLLAIQYIFNTYRNTESPYRNISRYGFARRYSPLQGHSGSTFSNFCWSGTARLIEAKFHMEPLWDVRNENLFKCSRSHDHSHIWWTTSKVIFFGTKRPMTLKLGIQHRVLTFSTTIALIWWPRVDLDHFYIKTESNLFPNASALVKAALSANVFPSLL